MTAETTPRLGPPDDPPPTIAGWVAEPLARTLPAPVRAAVLGHLDDPMLPAAELARSVGATRRDVLAAYGVVRADPAIRALVGSLYYPHRLRTAFAAATVAEWLADPDRVARLLAGKPVLSGTVELHPSKGTCAYRCQMCLWSDQDQLTYVTRELSADGLLSTADWCRVLDELHAGGVATVVLSGGGEALLNRSLPTILRHACQLGMAVHLYTTGYNLPASRADLWAELPRLAQVRFSIHSPTSATYDTITGLPSRLRALDRVRDNLSQLLALRDRAGTALRVGIGFVAQPVNVTEPAAMAAFAATVGVDFLDIRKDEVDVTGDLTPDQLAALRAQLITVRQTATAGGYGRVRVDLSDELVALANGQPIRRRRTPECLAKYFRPTISPYGIVSPCDLKAEPRFADSRFNLGSAGRLPLARTIAALADHPIADACAQCMPSSRTGNAVYHKLLGDLRDGVALTDQPFPFIDGTARRSSAPASFGEAAV